MIYTRKTAGLAQDKYKGSYEHCAEIISRCSRRGGLAALIEMRAGQLEL